MSLETKLIEARREHTADRLGERQHSLISVIRDVMEETSKAPKVRAHTPHGMHEPTAYIPEPAARSLVACLKTESLPELFDKSGKLRRIPNSAPAGVVVKMDAALIENSRVANAGAQIVVCPDAVEPRGDARGTVAVESIPVDFRNIEAAAFGVVDVDTEANAPVVDYPTMGARIDWDQAVTYGVRFDIPRSNRRRIKPDQLCGEIIASLTLGLARAADDVLLSALAAAGLTPFTLAKAAAQGLVFDELRALVGTSGAGATIGQDGVLRAAGINAELTGDMTGTIVGAWNRSGVAIKEDVTILFERIDAQGSLAVTCWAHMAPLVPDKNKFWVVA
jgi:hypothetical protein